METYSRIKLSRLLETSPLSIFNLNSLRQTLEIRTQSGLYPILKQFVGEKVLFEIKPGLYAKSTPPPEHFLIANYIITPSYVSFESALNYYGILSQFPLIITSATLQKTKSISASNGDYSYRQLSFQMYFGFTKSNDYLIATPEKALIDYIYLKIKNGTPLNLDEFDFDAISSKKLVNLLDQMSTVKGLSSIKKIIQEQTPCLPKMK